MTVVAVKNSKKKYRNKSNAKVLNLFSYKTPNIVVLGDKAIKQKLKGFEKFFNLTITLVNKENVSNATSKQTLAIIVDEAKLQKSPEVYLRTLVKKYKSLPIYFLSRKVRPNSFYTKLYELGLRGIINWPNEAMLLPELLTESLKPHPKAKGQNKSDERLANIIKSHLVLIGNYKNIAIKAISGFVFLNGTVKTLWDSMKIEEETQKTLGVKKVIIKDLKIRNNSKVSAKEIERKINIYIANLLGKEKKSIGVKVRNKQLELKGTSSNARAIQSIEEFSMKQIGINHIENNIKFKPITSKKNNYSARLIEKKIKQIFEGVRHVTIRIFGEYAELSGVVDIPADRPLIEKYVLHVLPIKKVINKLVIV